MQAYKQRKFDEDIVAIEQFGGKSQDLCTRVLNLGVEAIANKLRVKDINAGLDESDFAERENAFGSNYRAPIVAASYCSLFLKALDDVMLKVLIVAAIFSITFDMILSDAEHRKFGKYTI